jgi:hypothetical protein
MPIGKQGAAMETPSVEDGYLVSIFNKYKINIFS